ncbi:MAG: NUDIX domain-containing protein [Nanoarchaeota archaeon]|nr:NUDIX domain-containing protein [Nanoarchaeota archaeon]MBU1854204.1 NUDIX domain-containing protein [Nanoarchaeota archaeon]
MDKRVGAGFGVLILRDGKILLGHRHENPEKADSALSGEGTWTMPGGKMDFGETIEGGAMREVMEETSIKLNSLKVICLHNNMTEKAQFLTVGLFSDDFEGEPKVMEPDEITEWQWFDIDKLPTPMYFPSEKILVNYKLGVFYKK